MPSKRPPNRARGYHRSGEHTVSRALPYLLERVADEKLPAEQLTPLEAAARAWRQEAEQDLGGALAATKRALLDAAVGRGVLFGGFGRYLFQRAGPGGGRRIVSPGACAQCFGGHAQAECPYSPEEAKAVRKARKAQSAGWQGRG